MARSSTTPRSADARTIPHLIGCDPESSPRVAKVNGQWNLIRPTRLDGRNPRFVDDVGSRNVEAHVNLNLRAFAHGGQIRSWSRLQDLYVPRLVLVRLP